MLLQIFSGPYLPSAVFPPPPRRILPPMPHGSEGGRPFAGVGQGQAHGGGTIRIERILNLAWIPFVRKEMYNNFDPRQCPDLRDFGERAAHAIGATTRRNAPPDERSRIPKPSSRDIETARRAPESNAAGVCAGSRTRMRRRVFFMPAKGSRFGARRPQRRLQRRRSRSAAAAAGLRSLKPEIANRNTSRLFPAFGVGASVGRSSGAPPAAHVRARNAHLSRSAAA